MLLSMCSRLLKNLINIVEMTVYSYSIKLKYYNYTNEFFEYLKGKEDKNDIYDLRFDNHTIFFFSKSKYTGNKLIQEFEKNKLEDMV
jgi:hypothetical protein